MPAEHRRNDPLLSRSEVVETEVHTKLCDRIHGTTTMASSRR
jgi:hypothetical protein